MARSSIIVFVIDALRYDCVPQPPPSPHLRTANMQPPRLPALEELVAGACHFTQAIACAPYTAAAVASLLTGLIPPAHGVRSQNATSLVPGVQTLPGILREAGYRTCMMTDYPEITAPVGLLRDVDTVVRTEDDALAWWDGNANASRFLLLHLWDVHKPYGMPLGPCRRKEHDTAAVAAWRQRAAAHHVRLPTDLDEQPHAERERHQVNVTQCLLEQALGWTAGLSYYLEGLHIFDRGRLRRLVDACRQRGLFDEAILVVTSDHGEGRSYQTHARLDHSTNLLDDVIRIPLFIRLPQGTTVPRVEQQVSQCDIAPTLLALLGLGGMIPATASQPSLAGHSLVPLLYGQRLPKRPAYAEVAVARPARASVESAWLPPALVRYRCLRHDNRKYFLVGAPNVLTKRDLMGPAETFLRTLYHDVLGNYADADGWANWMGRLAEEAGTPKEVLRRSILDAFVSTLDAMKTPRYAIFDLSEDPMEENPQTPTNSRLFWLSYRPYLRLMTAIEDAARPGGPLIPHTQDEAMVEERLRALGYIE